MRVSAIILSFNSRRHLELCIRSLVASFDGGTEENEIWVVENGSHDGSADVLRALEQEFPGVVHAIYNAENTGTTRSRNSALRQAKGRYLLVMDSDATITRATVDGLIEVLDEDPTCGLVVPRLTYPDGRYQLSTDIFPTLGRKLERFLSLKKMEKAAHAEVPGKQVTVDYAISAVWMFRHDLLESVGYLDENIFYSPEDVDYCLRIWEKGYRILFEPSLAAIHDAQELSRGFRISLFTFRHAWGLFYLFKKHHYCFGLTRLYRRLARHAPAVP